MNFNVSSTVGDVNNQNSIVNSVRVDDWKADRAIIARDAYEAAKLQLLRENTSCK